MSAVVPDKISPEEGWRLWGVGAGLLRSLHKDELWHPQVAVRASCREPRTRTLAGLPHASPAAACMCGIYAAADPAVALGHAIDGPVVLGRVALWGTVIAGTDGWRAELAYPQALAIVTTPEPFASKLAPASVVVQLAATYRIPVDEIELPGVTSVYGDRAEPLSVVLRRWM